MRGETREPKGYSMRPDHSDQKEAGATLNGKSDPMLRRPIKARRFTTAVAKNPGRVEPPNTEHQQQTR
jgi:hypothetical protein